MHKQINMKKSWNLVAVFVAFFVGVCLCCSCTEKDDYDKSRVETSKDDLWAAIDALKSEVEELKAKLQEQENATKTECGEFIVEGLWFDRAGNCISPLKKRRQSSDQGSSPSQTTYSYDDEGRMVGYTTNTTTVTIQYDEKVQTTVSKTRSTVNGMVTTTTVVCEYE